MNNHNTLDITYSKKKGKDLHDEIVSQVKDSQKLILREHYDELLVTKEQFDDLMKTTTGQMDSYIPDFFIYNTGMSVMEVRVKDSPILLEL